MTRSVPVTNMEQIRGALGRDKFSAPQGYVQNSMQMHSEVRLTLPEKAKKIAQVVETIYHLGYLHDWEIV